MDHPQMLDEIVSELLMCRFILDLLMHLEELLQQLRITMLVVLRVQHLDAKHNVGQVVLQSTIQYIY